MKRFFLNILNFIKSEAVNHDVRNLFDLSNIKETDNILTLKNYKPILKKHQETYNRELFKFKRATKQYFKTGIEYCLRINDKDFLEDNLESLSLYDNSYINFRMHIGKGQSINDYSLSFNINEGEDPKLKKGIKFQSKLII